MSWSFLQSYWVQLTNFPGSGGDPALSPDGRMLAFAGGNPPQIYVKMLPDGQPAQLTHGNSDKGNPAISADGWRITYTTVNPQFQWDTWTVPVFGGETRCCSKTPLGWSGPEAAGALFGGQDRGPHGVCCGEGESDRTA
jgi:Tol biopolymer transport system component